MTHKSELHKLKVPQGDRVLSYYLDKDDNVRFVLTDRLGICDSFCLYQVEDDLCKNPWFARTPLMLEERLYHEKGLVVK